MNYEKDKLEALIDHKAGVFVVSHRSLYPWAVSSLSGRKVVYLHPRFLSENRLTDDDLKIVLLQILAAQSRWPAIFIGLAAVGLIGFFVLAGLSVSHGYALCILLFLGGLVLNLAASRWQINRVLRACRNVTVT